MQLVFIIIGGFLGSICRHIVGEWLYTGGFPLGTLVVNLSGCLLLGWFLTLLSIKKRAHSKLTLLIGTGFLGSFTTFSTFSVETIHLFQQNLAGQAFFYILTTIVLGLLLTFAGYQLAISSMGIGGSRQ